MSKTCLLAFLEGICSDLFQKVESSEGLAATRYWEDQIITWNSNAINFQKHCQPGSVVYTGSLCEIVMVSHAQQRERVRRKCWRVLLEQSWKIVDWVLALCQGRLVGFSYIWNMCLSIKSEMSLTYFGARLQPSRFGFFGLPDWPGLAPALAQRPVTKADVDLWGRANVLWQGGQHFGCKNDLT